VIGRYTDRISVQTMTRTNDGGQPVEAWETAQGLYRVAAAVETAGGRYERVFGSQLQGEATHTVRMAMPTDDIALTSRVLWHSRHGDRTLAIVGKAVTQDARQREVTLACAEPRAE
jgi:head-tail adaptor